MVSNLHPYLQVTVFGESFESCVDCDEVADRDGFLFRTWGNKQFGCLVCNVTLFCPCDKMSLIWVKLCIAKGRNQQGLVKTLSDFSTHVVKSQHICFHTEILQRGNMLLLQVSLQLNTQLVKMRADEDGKAANTDVFQTFPDPRRISSLERGGLRAWATTALSRALSTLSHGGDWKYQPFHLWVQIYGLKMVEVCQTARDVMKNWRFGKQIAIQFFQKIACFWTFIHR